MKTARQILTELESGAVPPVILVGGNSEFLIERTFGAIRERLLARDPALQIESFAETADLGAVLDAFRTGALFASKRLLIVPEVNAFVTKKEIASLYEKATADWKSAKTDRKRGSSIAKLLHLVGLVGLDLDASDGEIAAALAIKRSDDALTEMLEAARAGGKRATRGEGDAALLAEAIARGGAPGAILLMRTGDIPKDSATVGIIDRAGAVVACDMTRDQVVETLDHAVAAIAAAYEISFPAPAIRALRERLGIDRVLGDKFSRDVPDLRMAVLEAERIATFVGRGGKVAPQHIEQQIASVAGGARYEFASLISEHKPVEAIAKLRDLVAQARREDAKMPLDMQYGRFLFSLADELRQMIALISFMRIRNVDARAPMNYNRFKDLLAEPASEYLVGLGLARQKPHPFVLFKKFEGARTYGEERLIRALTEVAEIEFQRKSGGAPAELSLETLVLGLK